MTDTLSKEHRSALMKHIHRENTGPEMTVRRELHKRGLRYKIGDRSLPGSPDLSFPSRRIAIFVHGCFWHGHSCRQGRSPTSNENYWLPKIRANRERDARKTRQLKKSGWRVITVWECKLKKQSKLSDRMDKLAAEIRMRQTPQPRPRAT